MESFAGSSRSEGKSPSAEEHYALRKTRQHTRLLDTRPQIIAITGMRALLIFWIVLYHLQPELRELLPFSPLQNLAAAGYLGVDFFFITSGFVIAYNYATRLSPFSLQAYGQFLWLRLARIYPTHLFALLLVVLMFLAAGTTGAAVNNPEMYSLSSLFKNLFLVQAWSVPTVFSWNAVAWAVSHEWLAYLAFPLALAATQHIRNSSKVIGYIILLLWGMSALCLWLDTNSPAAYGAGSYGLIRVVGEFVAGCLLYNLYRIEWGKRWAWKIVTPLLWTLSIIGSALLVAPYTDTSVVEEIKTYQLYALWLTPLFCFSIYALTWQKDALARLLCSRLFLAGGHLSYALYLTHFICLIALRRVMPAESFAGQNVMLRLLLLLVYVGVMLIAAALTYQLVEKPGRRWMKRLLPQTTSQAS